MLPTVQSLHEVTCPLGNNAKERSMKGVCIRREAWSFGNPICNGMKWTDILQVIHRSSDRLGGRPEKLHLLKLQKKSVTSLFVEHFNKGLNNPNI